MKTPRRSNPFLFYCRASLVFSEKKYGSFLKEKVVNCAWLSVVCMFLGVKQVDAQFNETIFYDTVSKVSQEGIIEGGHSEGRYIYLTGGSYSNTYSIPSLTKIDTSGSVVWTSTDPELMATFKRGGDISSVTGKTTHCIVSGGHVFTVSRQNELWCIDDSSGNLLWKTKLAGDYAIKLADFNTTEMLVLTGHYGLQYQVVNKQTGSITFTSTVVPTGYSIYSADLLVDAHQHILISWGDTCYKYQDRELKRLLWKSSLPFYGNKSIGLIVEDKGQYILAGMNNVRAIDTLTGNVIWYRQVSVGAVPLVQTGTDCNPRKLILRDSLLYISWISPYVGGLDFRRAFAMTCVTTSTGTVKYNVAYDFTGVPADPAQGVGQDELDWLMDFCLDDNGNLYLTGSYDNSTGPGAPGNWGIMKLNGTTGEKMYEATITKTPLERNQGSQGLVMVYRYSKLYALGNLARASNSVSNIQPSLVSFDSTGVYHEIYRNALTYTMRYPSALVGMDRIGRSKMILLKMVGRSAVLEMRTEYNQLVWSRKFSGDHKFMIPHLVRNVHDTAIVASFLSMREEPSTQVYPKGIDTLFFVRLDTSGNIKNTSKLPQLSTDSAAPEPVQIYTDPFNRTGFIYKRWVYNGYTNSYLNYFYGFMPGSGQSNWGSITGTKLSPEEAVNILRKSIVSHYNADTMIAYYAAPGNRSSALFCSTVPDLTSNVYTGFSRKNVSGFKTIFSSIPVNKTSQVIFGTDSSDRMFAARYDFKLPDPIIWKHAQTPGTIISGDTSSSHIYSIAKSSDNKLVLSKIDLQTGLLLWNFEKPVPPGTSIVPLDFTFDQINQQFVVGGYLIDSSFENRISSYFFITLDTAGHIINEASRAGEIVGFTQINTIHTLQQGSHFYGGTLATKRWGTAGFYNVDCFGNIFSPAVEIKNANHTICPGTEAVFVADASAEGTKPQYQWLLNNEEVGENSDHFVAHTPLNGDQLSVRLTSNAACLRSDTVSNTISIVVNDGAQPGITLSGETHFNAGGSLQLNTSTINVTGQTFYQWQDSTMLHNWQNIPQATDRQLLYAPRFNGDKIRCMLYAENDCVKNFSTSSQTLIFTQEEQLNPDSSRSPRVRFYPNPVHTSLVIDSLGENNQWQLLEILSTRGNTVMSVAVTPDQKSIQINMNRLPAGVYIATLRGRAGVVRSYRFAKL